MLNAMPFHDIAGAEYRLVVARTEGIEFAQSADECGGDLRESDESVDVEQRLQLFGADVLGHVFFESARELRNVFLFQRQPHGIGVASEVLEEIAGGVDGFVDVESLNGA